MHVIAICGYDVNIVILLFKMAQKIQTHDKKRSLCTDAPLPLLRGGGVCTQATKKRLLKRRHLSTTGYPSTRGIFEIMCCVILTSNAIIWYLPPRLSWQHRGLSRKKKTLKIKKSRMSSFLTTSFWVSRFALQIRINLLGRGCHIQSHRLFPGWDTLVRIFPST